MRMLARTSRSSAGRILLLTSVVVASTGCDIVTADFKSKETAEWRKTYELRPGGRLDISNVNGKNRGDPSTAIPSKSSVESARAATADAAKAALERIEILEDVNAPVSRIETKSAWRRILPRGRRRSALHRQGARGDGSHVQHD